MTDATMRARTLSYFAAGQVLHHGSFGTDDVYTSTVLSLDPNAEQLQISIAQNDLPDVHEHSNADGRLLRATMTMQECIVPSMQLATPSGTARLLNVINLGLVNTDAQPYIPFESITIYRYETQVDGAIKIWLEGPGRDGTVGIVDIVGHFVRIYFDEGVSYRVPLPAPARESARARELCQTVLQTSTQLRAVYIILIHYIMPGGWEHFHPAATNSGTDVATVLDDFASSGFDYDSFAELAAEACLGFHNIFEQRCCGAGRIDVFNDMYLMNAYPRNPTDKSMDRTDVAPFWFFVTLYNDIDHYPERKAAARTGYEILCEMGMGVPASLAPTIPEEYKWLLTPTRARV